MKYFLESVKLIQLPHFIEDNGELVVIEAVKNAPFKIERVFVVKAPCNAVRGQHAHFKCTQFLICCNGSVKITCDDGREKKTFLLDRPNIGLLIPNSIWAEQNYIGDNSILAVMCDLPYHESDYMRRYEMFKEYRNKFQSEKG